MRNAYSYAAGGPELRSDDNEVVRMKVGRLKEQHTAMEYCSTNGKQVIRAHGCECGNRIVPTKLVRLRIPRQLACSERELTNAPECYTSDISSTVGKTRNNIDCKMSVTPLRQVQAKLFHSTDVT